MITLLGLIRNGLPARKLLLILTEACLIVKVWTKLPAGEICAIIYSGKEQYFSEPVLLKEVPMEAGRKGVTGNGGASRVWKGE